VLEKLKGVIKEVFSYRAEPIKRMRFKPNNRRIGTVTYTINVGSNVFVFTKLPDARHFKRLLKKGAPFVEPVIIRTDTTEEGYIVDERKIQ